MPKLTIDGQEIEVPKGTKVIEAAKLVGIDIPFYCYHPGLSVAGNCRMCLVEIEKMPKLQISCHMEAQDGMVVHTKTKKVEETRKHVLEFLLVNHPVDCPVCDQAGECWLQDYYLNYGAYESRVNENKVKKPKAVPVGPTVMLDAERCILCSRCVRFTDEISKTSELGIVNRGDHSEIQVFPGKELDNPYSGNVVDLCPVGALTDKDFRFKVRVWYLKSEETLCNGCSRGCNIQMQYRTRRLHHAEGERVMRLKPRFNEQVNQWWICDEGRYGYKFHDQNRILNPLIRKKDDIHEHSWDEMMQKAVQALESAKGKVGVFLSPQLSNEELYLAGKLFRHELKINDIFLLSPKAAGYQDDFLIQADKNPNTKGAAWLGYETKPSQIQNFFGRCDKGEIEGIIVFGQDLLTVSGLHIAEKTLNKLLWSLFIGSNHNLMSEHATFVLPSATYAEKEGTFTNCDGRVQKFNQVFSPLNEARAEWEILCDFAKRLGFHFHYDRTEDIFDEVVMAVEPFKGLSYEKLGSAGSDIRKFAAPMIPQFVQSSNLIFHHVADKPLMPAPLLPK